MEEKKGVSAIIFDNNGDIYFLIFHRIKGWKGWEFPKGGIEEGESAEEAIIREINEETGLKKFKIIRKLDIKREFVYQDIRYIYDIFIIESSMNIPVTIQQSEPEHDTYLWTTKERALEKLTWPEEKEVLKRVVEEIHSN